MDTFDEAVRLMRELDPDADFDPVWDLLVGIVEADHQSALEIGLAAVAGGDPVEVDTAVHLLGFTAETHEDVREEVTAVLVALAGTDPDADIRASIANSLGRTCHPLGRATLIRLAADPDSDVRFYVASSLPFVTDDDSAVDTLITLSRDDNEDVRNWATFGLGTLTTEDSPAIRSALLDRAHDTHRDTRQEGVVGLARRRDPRAKHLVATMLDNDDNAICIVEAAGYLADPDLVGPLSRFSEHDDDIAAALTECDPQRRELRDAYGWEVLTGIAAARPDMDIGLGCVRYEVGTWLLLDGDWWVSVSPLMERFPGDAQAAAADLLSVQMR